MINSTGSQMSQESPTVGWKKELHYRNVANNSNSQSEMSIDSCKDSSDFSPSKSDAPPNLVAILSRSIRQSRKVFIGTYTERRYVEPLKVYRDIVVIDQNERELINCLEEIKNVVAKEYGTEKWLGITYDAKDSVIQTYSLWVELENIPLGRHWFQLRSIKVDGNAVQVRLKYLRMFESNERKSLDATEYPTIDYREVLTYENACNALKFFAVFVMSLLTVICNALWYLGDYSLKLTHELSGVIRSLTPIAFGVIDFFSKCVGGFYWLIYMLWRGNSVPVYPVKPPIQTYSRRSKNYGTVRPSISYY